MMYVCFLSIFGFLILLGFFVSQDTYSYYPFFLLLSEKDGYHELHNEPNGVKDRFIDECISWVEARLPSSSSVPSPTQKEDSAVATTAKL